MNPALFLGVICFLFPLLFGILSIAVAIFRVSCRWCNMERPSFGGAALIVFVSWLVWSIVETILVLVLQEVYEAIGYPLWEARIVSFFIGLPLDLIVATVLHAAMMKAPLSKSVEVWFVQRLILLSLVLAGVGIFAVGFLASKG